MTCRLADVLSEATNDAAVLRLHGQAAQAATLERFRDAVADAMADYLDWLSEDEATLKCGRGVAYLKHRFADWQAAGLARTVGTGRRARRLYRRIVIPQRANLEAAYQQGRRAS